MVLSRLSDYFQSWKLKTILNKGTSTKAGGDEASSMNASMLGAADCSLDYSVFRRNLAR